MSLSKYLKFLIPLAIVGVAIILFFFNYEQRNHSAKKNELEDDFVKSFERAETFKNIQLDSALRIAYHTYQLASIQGSDFGRNISSLQLSEIKFLKSGANIELYNDIQKCEKWFKTNRFYKKAFDANLLRLEVKSFLEGSNSVSKDLDDLVITAKLSESNSSMGRAYYFKMEHRDIMRNWGDDVHILDSARMFAIKAKDTVLVSKIRMMSVFPINGKPASFDSTFISLNEALNWNSSELKCMSYLTLGMEYGPSQRADSALFYLKKYLGVSNDWGSKTHEMTAYQRIVRTHLYANNYDAMILNGKTALSLARKTRNKEVERILLKEIGLAWSRKGKFHKGIDYAIDALEIAHQLKDEDGVFSSQYFLVDFLLKTERLSEANVIISEMSDWIEKKEKSYVNDNRHARALVLKGRLMTAQNNLDGALYIFRKTAKLLLKHNGKPRLSVDLKIFETLVNSHKVAEAKVHSEFMRSLYVSYQSKHYYRKFHLCEGLLMLELGEKNKAIIAFNRFLKLSRVSNSENVYTANVQLSKLYSDIKDYKRASEHSQKALKIKEEIVDTKDQLKLEKIQSKNDLANKEVEIGQLKIDRLEQKNSLEAKESSLQRRRLFIIFLSILLVLLGVIALFIYNRAKQARIREEFKRSALEKERQIEILKTEESERTIELKNQLFANISHEFRTPLTLIQVPVDELMENASVEDQNSLQVVKRNADHLLVMVDEILELTKLDTGNTTLSKKAFYLNEFIQRLQMNFEPIFRQNSIQFEIDLPSEEFTAVADEYRLKMVLNNLLKNALHHTPKESLVRLQVVANREGNKLELALFNSGDWIDEAFLPTIFDRYARSKEKEYSGYGIGLSFSKQIIALHNGEINAENVDGGVLLSFTIPTKFENKDASFRSVIEPIFNSSKESMSDGENKLLIVEDNSEMQTLLKDILSDKYEIILAENGEEGIQMAKENQPDLIVSDIMMPKVEGTELARTLKEEFSTSHIPIILLTAKATDQDRITGLETGADDYLTKPFSPKELKVRVKNLIEQRERLRRRFSKNVFLIPEEITSNSLDQEFLIKATEIVQSNLLETEFSVERFCRALALNRNSVHQKLKSLTGQSASQFIKSIKLKKAATLLADERISIVEVSELAGFNNRQAFNKAFKDQFEMTPSDYRKKCLNENK